jgi:hypothetical protein
MQPDYNNNSFKVHARRENIRLYRKLTSLKSIPANRGYWTLCNWQPTGRESEISQLIRSGLITKNQFFGVDRDAAIIAQNRAWHPEAHWYAGEWLTSIECEDAFEPGMVYLDSTNFADHHAAIELVVGTMLRCPSGTVLLVNVMMNDPRSSRKFNSDKLIGSIVCRIPASELTKWDSQVINYDYSMTGLTKMGTFAFHKRS